MAHGYKEVFASSTMDIPFSFTKLAQQEMDVEYDSNPTLQTF